MAGPKGPNRLVRSLRVALWMFAAVLAALFFCMKWLNRPEWKREALNKVRDEVKARAGVDLEAEDFHFDLIGRLQIEGVRLSHEGKPLVEASRAVVRFRLGDLLRKGTVPRDPVRSVFVEKPEIHAERGEDGVWNFARLKGPEAAAPGAWPQFRIALRDGKADIVDRFADPVVPGGRAEVAIPSANAGLYGNRGVVGSASLEWSGASVAARWNWFQSQGLDVTFEAKRLPAAALARMRPIPRIEVREGTLDVAGSAQWEPGTDEGPLKGIRFNARIDGGGLTVSEGSSGETVRIPKLEARATERGAEIGRLEFEWAGGRGTASGAAAPLQNPAVRADASFAGLDVGKLNGRFPALKAYEKLKGRASGAARFQGTLDRFKAAGSVNVKGLSAAGKPLGGLALTWEAAEKGFQLTSGTLKAPDGGAVRFIGAGVWDREKGALKEAVVSAEADSYTPRDLFRLSGTRLPFEPNGPADGDFVFHYDGGRARLYGSFDARGVDVRNVKGARVRGSLRIDDPRFVRLDRLVVETGEGIALLHGAYDLKTGSDFVVDAGVIPASELLRLAGRPDIEARGDVTFSGRISGYAKTFEAAFEADGGDLALEQTAVDRLKGSVVFGPEGLRLDGLTLRVDGRDQKASAWIPYDLKKGWTAEAEGDRIALKPLVPLLEKVVGVPIPYRPEWAGELTGVWSMGVAGGEPFLSGPFRIEGAEVEGRRVDEASARVEAKEGVVKFSEGRARLGRSVVAFDGKVEDGEMDLQASSAELHVEDVKVETVYKVAGTVRARAKASGPVENPRVEGFVESTGLSIEGLSLESASAALAYENDAFTIENARVQDRGELAEMSGQYRPGSQSLRMDLTFQRLSADTLNRFLKGLLPPDFQGRLDGGAALYTYAGDLSGEFAADSADLALGKVEFDAFHMEGSFKRNRIDRFELEGSSETGARVTGKGNVDFDDPMRSEIEFDMMNVDLDRLAGLSFFEEPLPVSGSGRNISVKSIDVDGVPMMLGSISAADVGLGELRFDRALGVALFDGQSLFLDGMKFLRGDQTVDLSGFIPLAAFQDGVMALRVDTNNVSADLFKPIVDRTGFDVKGRLILHGCAYYGAGKFGFARSDTAEGAYDLTGLLRKTQNAEWRHPAEEADALAPCLQRRGNEIRFAFRDLDETSNELALRDGFINRPEFLWPLRDVELQAQTFARKRKDGGTDYGVSLILLQGWIEDESFTVSGEMLLDNLAPKSLDLAVSADDIPFGYGSLVRTRAAVAASLQGPFDAPELSGWIALSEGSINLPKAAAVAGGGKERKSAAEAFPIRFAEDASGRGMMRVSAKDGVRVRDAGGNLQIVTAGDISLGGSLLEPRVDGALQIRPGGRFRLPTLTTFTIYDEGELTFQTVGGSVMPLVRFDARTRSEGDYIYLQYQGPLLFDDPALLNECAQAPALVSAPTAPGAAAAPSAPSGSGPSWCPRIQVRSDDDKMTEHQILARVSHASAFLDADGAGEKSFQDILRGAAGDVLSPTFSLAIEKEINVDAFELSFDSERNLVVGLQKDLDEKWAVQFSREFTERDKFTFGASYNFRKKSYVEGEIDNENNQTVKLNYRFDF